MVRTKYSLEYKWRVVNIFLNASPKVSLGKMERITNIKRQLISGWIKNKDKLEEQVGKRYRSRLPNVKDSCLYPLTEAILKDWIISNKLF